MATETTAPPARAEKAPKIHRLQIGANVIVQVALILLLAAMVNYLGLEHYHRWDLSRDKKYELSDKTKRFLDSINGKVRFTLLFSSRNPLMPDVQSLLTEYQYAAKGKIDVEMVDPQRELTRTKELIDKYKVVANEEMVIAEYDGRNKVVKGSEMAEVDEGNAMFGQEPRIAAFKGEQAITGALIDLVENRKNTVGYVLGHKEPALADKPPTMATPMMPQAGESSPISVLKMVLENENIALSELSLFDVPAIPEEMKTIIALGPQYDFSEREMQLLRAFWEKGGRILLLYDPAAKMPRLTAFLSELGVRVNDDRLMAMMRTGIQELALVRDVYAKFLGESPITKRLADANALFRGGTSSLTLEAERVRPANIRLQPLIEAEHGYWAEKDYNSGDQEKYQANAAAGQNAVYPIAVSIEKGGSGDERVEANSSRLVLVSNAGFIQDNALTQDQQGLDFISAAVNWLLSREQLIGIAPKVPRTLTFMLEESTLRNLRWLILVLIPLVPAAIGAAVWWRRRA